MMGIDIVTLTLAKNHTDSTVAIGGVLSGITRQPDGTLEFTFTPTGGNPVTFNAGIVPAGRSITNAELEVDGNLILTFDDGDSLDVGKVTGKDGKDGRELEVRAAGTSLEFRYVGTDYWIPVFDFATIEIPAAIIDYVEGATYHANDTFTSPDTGIIYRANRNYTSVTILDDLENGDIRQIGGGGATEWSDIKNAPDFALQDDLDALQGDLSSEVTNREQAISDKQGQIDSLNAELEATDKALESVASSLSDLNTATTNGLATVNSGLQATNENLTRTNEFLFGKDSQPGWTDDVDSIIPTTASETNKLVTNNLMESSIQSALNSIPTGLKPPIEIDLESDLPPEAGLTSANVGLFYIIQNMDISAEDRTGKAWANYKDGNSNNPVVWYRVYDQYYSADGDTITLSPTGQLQVAMTLIYRIRDSEQAIEALEQDSHVHANKNDLDAIIIGNLAQRSLVDISDNTAYPTIHSIIQAMRGNAIRTRHMSGVQWANYPDAPTGIGTIGGMVEIVSESSSATHTAVRITTMNTAHAREYWRTASASGWWQADWYMTATRDYVENGLNTKRNVVPTPIIAGQDLNDPLLLSGVYTISATVLPTLINAPPFDLGNTNCLLFVEKTIGDANPRNTSQRLIAARADGVNANREFTRSSSANQLVWLEWQENATQNWVQNSAVAFDALRLGGNVAAAYPRATTIGLAWDLNTMIDPGLYMTTSNANTSALLNKPFEVATGMVTVVVSASGTGVNRSVNQKFTHWFAADGGTQYRMYERTIYTFAPDVRIGGWVEILTTSAGVSFLGALTPVNNSLLETIQAQPNNSFNFTINGSALTDSPTTSASAHVEVLTTRSTNRKIVRITDTIAPNAPTFQRNLSTSPTAAWSWLGNWREILTDNNGIRYDTPQNLTPTQQQVARANIGAGADLRNRPDLWTPNTEVDLGGGEFGWLATGTLSGAPNTIQSVYINAIGISRIVDKGGEWNYIDGQNSQIDLGGLHTTGGTVMLSSCLIRNPNHLSIETFSTWIRTSQPYWFWVIYRK
jgi:hypothetical protein